MSNWQTDLAEDLKWQPIMPSHVSSSVQADEELISPAAKVTVTVHFLVS